jgi:hypothetical protein
MARSVLAPDGRMWKVGRQWLPFRVKIRRERELPDVDPSWWVDPLALADAGLGGLIVGLGIAVTVTFLILFVWPVVAIALELVILFLALIVATAGRFVLRRPWRIVARSRSAGPATLAWHVVGWRESGRVIDEVADSLAGGNPEPSPRGASRVMLEP